MNPFIESLKRLYQTNAITLDKLEDLVNRNKITENDLGYIKESKGNGGV